MALGRFSGAAVIVCEPGARPEDISINKISEELKTCDAVYADKFIAIRRSAAKKILKAGIKSWRKDFLEMSEGLNVKKWEDRVPPTPT